MMNRKPFLFFVLEDNAVYAELIPLCLNATLPESQAVTFKNPADLFYALQGKPDLIVSEFSFQEDACNGITILKKVRELSPGTRVIFLTSHPNISDAIHIIRSGASDYIPKSKIALDQLIRKVLLIKRYVDYKHRSDRLLKIVATALAVVFIALAVLTVCYHLEL